VFAKRQMASYLKLVVVLFVPGDALGYST